VRFNSLLHLAGERDVAIFMLGDLEELNKPNAVAPIVFRYP